MNTLDKAISNKIKSGKDKIEVLKQSMRNTVCEIEECLDSAGDHMSETMVKLLETITETLSKQLEGYTSNGRIEIDKALRDELMTSDDGIQVYTYDKTHSIHIYFNFEALPFPQIKATAFPLAHRGNGFYEEDCTAKEIKVIG
mgnify:CR=1 FL=1|tara:strand:+ start:2051 stop:2479 length:429 start_codon:yes stop_codon:yes gene_type:complete